jgi:hypothetical protein
VFFSAAAGTPLDDQGYKISFKFTGKIDKLTITLESLELTSEDVKKLKIAEARVTKTDRQILTARLPAKGQASSYSGRVCRLTVPNNQPHISNTAQVKPYSKSV